MATSRRTALICAAALLSAGCNRGILDPVGPVGAAEKQILINSTAIMLAIVIPTIIATVAFAWWFRRGNKKAKYRPDWEYSGAIELVVWAHPGADHHAARRDHLDRQPRAGAEQAASIGHAAAQGRGRRRSIGNGCSSIPTRASPPSINWSFRPARPSISG